MPEPGCGERQITVLERGTPFSHIEVRILGAVVRGHQIAARAERCRGFLLSSCTSQRQAELVVRVAAFRLEPRRLGELVNRFGDLAGLQQRFAEREVSAPKRRRERDHLAQMLDFLCGAAVRAGAVGHGQIELRFHRAGRQRDRLLQLANGGIGVDRRERGAEVGPGLRILRSEPHRFAQGGDPRFVLT